MGIRSRLIALRDAVHAPAQDRAEILRILEATLVWLNENKTDENCRAVDASVSTAIVRHTLGGLPEDIAAILWDVGGALHDTHSNPQVALGFFSTPLQVLERLRNIEANPADS
jgi:hypothetical protein